MKPRSWTEYLPGPFGENCDVVVYMVPAKAKYQHRAIESGPDAGSAVGFYLWEGVHYPLQSLDPNHSSFHSNREEMRRLDAPCRSPVAYTGPMADIHQRLLRSIDFVPLVFQRNAMHEPFFHLVEYMTTLSKDAKENGYSD